MDMESRKAHREMLIDKLLDFNRNELSKLVAERQALDAKLLDARKRAAEAADRVAACRALVAARKKGAILHSADNINNAVARQVKAKAKSNIDIDMEGTSKEKKGTIAPIGICYTNLQKRFHAPRQSFTGTTGTGEIHLNGPINIDVKPSDRLVITYWFDRNGNNWREFVRPPRLTQGRIGVFATRSPNRPTPVGLSLCEVASVSHPIVDTDSNNIIIHCSGVDILDETPILSVRVYDSEKDSFSSDGVRSGWLDDAEIRPLHYDEATERVPVRLCTSSDVENKLEFLKLKDIVVNSLERQLGTPVGKKKANNAADFGVLPIGAFRILYKRDEAQAGIAVVDVVSGFRDEVCREEADVDPEAALHAEFKKKYPCNEEILWNWGKD